MAARSVTLHSARALRTLHLLRTLSFELCTCTVCPCRPDDGVEQGDVGIAHEPGEQRGPRRVGMKPLVEFRRDPPYLRQTRPGNRHEIVMLRVIADVERHLVEGTVVRIRLLAGNQ